jgi:hypothetical protein
MTSGPRADRGHCVKRRKPGNARYANHSALSDHAGVFQQVGKKWLQFCTNRSEATNESAIRKGVPHRKLRKRKHESRQHHERHEMQGTYPRQPHGEKAKVGCQVEIEFCSVNVTEHMAGQNEEDIHPQITFIDDCKSAARKMINNYPGSRP